MTRQKQGKQIRRNLLGKIVKSLQLLLFFRGFKSLIEILCVARSYEGATERKQMSYALVVNIHNSRSVYNCTLFPMICSEHVVQAPIIFKIHIISVRE